MLDEISYSPACNHSRLRAQIPRTTLEQLKTVRTRRRAPHGCQNARSIPGAVSRSTTRAHLGPVLHVRLLSGAHPLVVESLALDVTAGWPRSGTTTASSSRRWRCNRRRGGRSRRRTGGWPAAARGRTGFPLPTTSWREAPANVVDDVVDEHAGGSMVWPWPVASASRSGFDDLEAALALAGGSR